MAVSGGADSVALLRLLLEVRSELGVVLSVAHFNHKIRGQEADEDAVFVRELAARHELPFHAGSADTPQFAREQHLGLEAAGRQLRHWFFRDLIRQNKIHKIATAHTLDDQAETVLLRLMRGAGTKGLAGVHPELRVEGGSIVRPLLGVRREELRIWLNSQGQDWREDATNADLSFTRNRIRHKLLPLLEAEFGSAALSRLAETAEIARAEEEYWEAQLESVREEEVWNERSLSIKPLLEQPLAMQRRLVRAMAQRLGVALDLHHVEQVLALTRANEPKTTHLPGGLCAEANGDELLFEIAGVKSSSESFSYKLCVPGEIQIPELNYRVRFSLVERNQDYDPAQLLRPELSGSELVIRNWHAGDRFWPLHSKSDKKVKELLKPNRVPAKQRALWPVAEYRGEIVWVRGLPVAKKFCAEDHQSAIVVEEVSVPQRNADSGTV